VNKTPPAGFTADESGGFQRLNQRCGGWTR
jgi:hypothetical protein